jgi:3D (Asp-Asp-Asp) domain-containing protein
MRIFLTVLAIFATICVIAAHPASALPVKVTAYAPVPKCTKRVNPHITASGHRISPEDHFYLIALSPDLARKHKFGDRFRLEVGGETYVVEYQDRMPNQHRKKIDFLLPSVRECNEFGAKKGDLIPLK